MSDITGSAPAPATAAWTDPIAAAGENVLENVEGGLSTVVGWIEGTFHRRPYLGATFMGGLGLGAASAVGVAEVTFTLVFAYIGYRVFAYGESFAEAVTKGIELRHGKLPAEKDTDQ